MGSEQCTTVNSVKIKTDKILHAIQSFHCLDNSSLEVCQEVGGCLCLRVNKLFNTGQDSIVGQVPGGGKVLYGTLY